MWERIPVSPDGRYIATATVRGDTRFRTVPGLEKTLWLRPNEKLMVTGVAFFRDGRHVVTASVDKTARIWDLANPQAEPSLVMHSDVTGFRSVALSPDERRIAVGDDLGCPRKVKLFDAAKGKEVAVLEGPMSSIVDLAFQPDGDGLVAVAADAVFVWRAPSWPEIAAKERLKPNSSTP
jgi:WD40 repeat protein